MVLSIYKLLNSLFTIYMIKQHEKTEKMKDELRKYGIDPDKEQY